MCTVSYVPLPDGYIVTSNRDEDPLRNTLPPQKQRLFNGETILAPIDVAQRGTWVATNTRNKTACLLNGAFQKHERTPPYRRSRGQYVIEAFTYNTFVEFVEKTDFESIEPFTLLFVEKGAVQTLVWDGRQKHYSLWEWDKPRLWSSATLYTPEEKLAKEQFFFDALQGEKKIDKTLLLSLHGLKKDTPFILNKPRVRTVSIVQIISKKQEITLDYYPKTN